MPPPSTDRLTPELASQFARIALGHVEREYPHKLDHVLASPEDVRGPRDLHPIYFGSFDWHSCVHGYWLLASLLRLQPDIPEAGAIRLLFDQAFTHSKVGGEVDYLARPSARGFERPYGWAWLLKLQAELMAHETPWAATHQPLGEAFSQRFRDFLPLAPYPIRTGVHSSTAFALALASDYAEAVRDGDLLALFEARARDWHLADRNAQAWEPSGEDFLSPTLTTAVLMRRVLPPSAFHAWFADYLPRLDEGKPLSLFTPAVVTDRTDGKIVHLDGLNLSRAWCWREIAAALPADDPVRATATEAAARHLAASLPYVAGDYMGEHWLASFALLALTAG
ncbi:DUF2891 domain-containing protein [uncultured Phenylobacterium sp.]|uniref:DUF2891 domain-containing protein n=1 Tax=uncultured Phenylobacterium sp. TaxID=349273 RepID=UPI0025F9B918|nr:DUF2891 domain-containing protein [uncultured Phenylobacterium sp.]